MAFAGKTTSSGSTLPDLVDDVSDLVRIISPFETPLLDAIGDPSDAAISTRHEWLDYRDDDDERKRVENFTQIFIETVTISGSLDAVSLHGVDREFDYQVIDRLRELMRQLEQSVISGVKAKSEGEAPRRTMGGLLEFIGETHNADGVHLEGRRLTDAIGACWNKGGSPNTIVCNGYQKRKISGFIRSGTQFVAGETRLRSLIDVFESERGVLRVILSRWVPADKLLLLDLSKIQVLPLTGRSFHVKPLAATGDFRKAQVVGEYTLEIQNASDGAHAVITNLGCS